MTKFSWHELITFSYGGNYSISVIRQRGLCIILDVYLCIRRQPIVASSHLTFLMGENNHICIFLSRAKYMAKFCDDKKINSQDDGISFVLCLTRIYGVPAGQ